MKQSLFLLLLAFCAFTFNACKDRDDERETLKKEVLENYAGLVLTNYEDCYQTANHLKQVIEAFVQNPTETGFQACKDAWLAARLPYGQSEAFRFYGGPIDDADGPEGLMNAWPMDENFIDYVDTDPNAGIINSTQVINKQMLKDLNEFVSEESIFTGYHAIEFLLWGQDLSASGPGNRPYTDYEVGGTAANQARRGEYLKVVAELLLENLASVRDEWAAGSAFPQQFLNETETNVALGFLFESLGEFSKGELSGERMFVAIDTRDQENEHSCFSDNTINDIRMNFLGLKNVYFGQYLKVDGSTFSGRSLDGIADQFDPSKAAAVRASFADAEAKIWAIPGPFDQTIANYPDVVVPAIEALRTLSDRITDVGLSMGAKF